MQTVEEVLMASGAVKSENPNTPPIQQTETKTEVPSVEKTETKIETPEVKSEAPAVEKKEAKTEETKIEKSFEKLYEERTGFKWEDSHIEKIKAETPKPYEFKSEYSKKLEEYVSQGGREEDFISTQTVNFEKMDATDLIANNLLRENPDMTDEEVELRMKVDYGMDNWNEDKELRTDEEKLQRLKFERDANRAKTDLIAYQKKWAIPTKDNSPKINESEQKEKFASEWNQMVKDNLKGYSKETFVLDKDSSFEFGADTKSVEKAMNDLVLDAPKYLTERYLDKQGNTDFNKFRKDMFILNNFDEIVKKAAEHGRAEGAKSVVKEIKNAKPAGTGEKPLAESTESAAMQVGRKMGYFN